MSDITPKIGGGRRLGAHHNILDGGARAPPLRTPLLSEAIVRGRLGLEANLRSGPSHSHSLSRSVDHRPNPLPRNAHIIAAIEPLNELPLFVFDIDAVMKKNAAWRRA